MFSNNQRIMANIRFYMLKNIKIPIEIFQIKLLSPSENIVYFLTYQKQLKQNEIAFLLKRDPRTIWTTLIRAERKMKELKQGPTFQEEKLKTQSEIREMVLT